MKKLLIVIILLLVNCVKGQDFDLVGVPGVIGEVYEIVVNPFNEAIIYTVLNDRDMFISFDGGVTNEPRYIDNYSDARITDISIPSEESIVYGDFNNGYFKSVDQGVTWNLINKDETPNSKVIKLNPLNANKYYIKKNTNEFWRSDDGGRNWQKVTNFSEEIVKFEIHPLDTSIIYFATLSRLYKSTNSGIDWTEQKQLSFMEDIQVNPLDTSVIYIQADNYLYKSVNSGSNVEIIFHDDPYLFKLNTADTNVVYVSNNLYMLGTVGGLHKSIDGGKNWALLEGINNITGPCKAEIGCLPPVFAIETSRTNPQLVYAGSLFGKGIFKSDDGGVNWSITNLALTYPSNIIFDKDNPDFLVAGHLNREIIKTNDGGKNWYSPKFDIEPSKIEPISNSFDLNPKNKLEGYLASSNGLYKTTDGGSNWFRLDEFDIATYNVYYHKFQPDTLFLNSVPPYYSFDGGTMWAEYESGFPSLFMKFVKTNPTLVYTIRNEGKVYKSFDLGKTWIDKTEGLVKQAETGTYARITSLEPDINNPDIVYCGQKGSMSKSIDGGDSWFRVDSTLLSYEPKMNQPKILLDPNNPDRIYVGLLGYTDFITDEYTTGGLFLTEDGCKTWKKVYSSRVRDIFTDEGNPRYIYLSTDYGLMRFLDTLTVTDVIQTKPVLPKKFVLEQNYPNPFNPSTTIKYSIPRKNNVLLKLFDVLGSEVATLVNKEQSEGNYEIKFDGKNLTSGIYFYRLQAGEFVETKKMLFMK